MLTLPNLTATDNSKVKGVSYMPSAYASLGTYAFPVGTTQISFTALDTTLNFAAVTLIVIVVDNQPPIFDNCPSTSETNGSTFVANTTIDLSTASVSWPEIRAHDNVDGARVRITEQSTPYGYTDGSLFRVGTTTVQYSATDFAGNLATCTFSVEINDIQAPILTCPSSFHVNTPSASEPSAVVNWLPPRIIDNYRVQSYISTLQSGTFSAV